MTLRRWAQTLHGFPSITLPCVDCDWLQSFSDSLFEQLNYYGMQLIGGDTTRGPIGLTYTVHGLVPNGRRCLAQERVMAIGFMSLVLSVSAAGLAILQDKLNVENVEHQEWLIGRHLRHSHGFYKAKR